MKNIKEGLEDLKDFIFPRYRYNWWDKIKYTFKPRQRWIKKYIKYNPWCDKTALIPDFLYGCVVHFVEDEECFERVLYSSDAEHIEFAAGLTDCYKYIKFERPLLEKAIDDALDDASGRTGPYDAVYGEYNRLELKLDTLDKLYMSWIVKFYGFMWV